MKFQRAKPKDLKLVTETGMFLWPNDRKDQVVKAMRTALSSPEHAVIICKAFDGEAVGFTDVSLGRDYVPGVTAFPVA